MPRSQDYSEMTVSELEKLAKDAGMTGYSGMKKDELIRALEKGGKSGGASPRAGSSGSLPGVLATLKEEHDEVKSLFETFEQQAESNLEGTRELVTRILDELTRHAEMEEQIVYPSLKSEDEEIYHEAHEEHHVMELLIGELRNMRPDGAYQGKVTVLGENVRHHIEEEESEAFEMLRQLPSGKLDEMASAWQQMKSRWKSSRRAA